MIENNIPDWLTGVWRRLSIETEAGERDITTQVFWLQTHRCFGDIRIPANRPDLKQKSWSTLTSADAIALSTQQGFAGMAELKDMTCQWHRSIDYQPFSGQNDIGALQWEGDILIEYGVEATYREEWQRLDGTNTDFTALIGLTDDSNNWQKCLVTAGDYFIYTRNRPITFPTNSAFPALIQSSEQTTAIHYLDCEISFGVCRSGTIPWQIQHSTLPWREGQPLWERSTFIPDLDQQQLIQLCETPEGQTKVCWMIQEWGSGILFQN